MISDLLVEIGSVCKVLVNSACSLLHDRLTDGNTESSYNIKLEIFPDDQTP